MLNNETLGRLGFKEVVDQCFLPFGSVLGLPARATAPHTPSLLGFLRDIASDL